MALRARDKLLNDVNWALENGLPPRDLVPMLRSLLAQVEPESAEALRAKRHLAELLVESDPWRAAGYARDVLKAEQDDRSYAVLGLAHTLLGNFRAAASAYRSAIHLRADCAWYLHNLGHLLDVALKRPEDALLYLRKAHLSVPDEPEMAASYAHALLRTARESEARSVLAGVLEGPAEVEALLARWSRVPG
ncbi:MAG: hypothetical protein SFV15_17020 [Polyangiaceae bacterium]|nr:hypothetical protein [Polyangiaceae bacterium]